MPVVGRMARLTPALGAAYNAAAQRLPDSVVFTGTLRKDQKAAEQMIRAAESSRKTPDGKPIKTRRRTLPDEASVLFEFFKFNSFPASFERDELAAITGMKPRYVPMHLHFFHFFPHGRNTNLLEPTQSRNDLVPKPSSN